jgi:hypothetical protein
MKTWGILFLFAFHGGLAQAKTLAADSSIKLADMDRRCMLEVEGRKAFRPPSQVPTANETLREMLKVYDKLEISISAQGLPCHRVTLGELPSLMRQKGIVNQGDELSRIARLADAGEMRDYMLKEYPRLGRGEADRIARFIYSLDQDLSSGAGAVAPKAPASRVAD